MVPCAVDSDKVTAKYENGVLTITLPRHEATKLKRIEIKTPPRRILVTHGEESAATAFGEFLSEKNRLALCRAQL